MIKKQMKYGLAEDVTIAHFGSGDILMACAIAPEVKAGYMVFKNIPNGAKMEIGQSDNSYTGRAVKKDSVDILFVFEKTESIDVMMDILAQVKHSMLNK